MKMKRNILLLASVSVVILAGCSKYLEETPDMRTEANTISKISELLTSAYPRANYIPFMEAASDNAGDKGPSAGSGVPVNRDPWLYVDVEDDQQDSPTYYWNAAYAAVAAANQALKSIEELSDTTGTSSLRGEALVARAYAHFMLVTIFSSVYDPNTAAIDPGIPYVTEPEETVIKQYDRKTVKYVYEQIERDLMEGLPLISDTRYRVPKYHFTTAAAHAFAARFYLFKQEYQKVVDHANRVFGENIAPYLRYVNTASFRSAEYYSKQAWHTDSENPSNILLVEATSWWGRNYAGYRYGINTELLGELFYSNNVSGGQYAYMVYGGTELVYNIPKFREHFVRSGLNANYGYGYNMVPLFAADELILNRAEAYAMMGNNDKAIEDLNTFAAAKVYVNQNNPIFNPAAHSVTVSKLNSFYAGPSLQYNIIQAVLDFKRREFVHEGLRWLDVLRHRITVTHRTLDQQNTYILEASDPRRMFQLPQTVILSGVQPNPR